MEPKIITKPAFDVVGMSYLGKNKNNDISRVWDHFLLRIDEIKNMGGDAYGVCGQVEPDGSFHYLAGFEVSTVGDLPSNMAHWTVPEQTYAVFPCTLRTIHETYHHAYQNWLPQSGYIQANGPDLEFYPPQFNAETGTGMYIYIPVIKRKS